MRMGLEMIVLPVEDVDRAKEFYSRLGFTCDVDHQTEDMRVVQFTPPGSDCSIVVGRGLGAMTATPVVGLHLVVADLAAAVDEVRGRGIEVGDPFYYGPAGMAPGIDPDHPDYASYAQFSDPDGNVWLLQEVPSRGE